MQTFFINSLLIIITYIQEIKSISEFKAFKSNNENFEVFNQKGLYIYNTNLQINYYKYYEDLDPSISLSVSDLKKFLFSLSYTFMFHIKK